MAADKALWDVGVEVDHIGDMEAYARLILYLTEPVDVSVGPRVGSGKLAVGMLLEASNRDTAIELAQQLARSALREIGLPDVSISVYYVHRR